MRSAAPPPRCECASSFALPERGSIAPTNARIWVFDAPAIQGRLTSGTDTINLDGTPTGERVVSFTPTLAPGATYTFESEVASTAFTTGNGPDLVAPASPVVTSVSIDIGEVRRDGRGSITRMIFDGTFPADAPLVRITIEDTFGKVVFITTPSRHDLCDPALWVAPGKATVSFAALDLAGNESPAVTLPIEVVAKVSRLGPCSEGPRQQCSTGAMGAFMLGAVIVGGLAGMVLIFVWRRVRGPRLDSRARESLSLLVAEHLARGARFRDGLATAIILAAIVGCWLDDARSAIFGVVGAIVFLAGFATAARALHLIELPSASAELRGSRMIVRSGSTSATINITSRGLARARRAAVPTSRTLG